MNLHVSLQSTTDELLSQPNVRLRIGEHVIDVGALRVLTRPEHARLTSKAVAVLIELVRDAGNTLTRDQLLDRVWKGRCPTPDVLTQAIKELRRAFEDDARPPRYIETIPKVGYRLLAQVLVLEGPEGRVFVDDGVPPRGGLTPVNGAAATPVRAVPAQVQRRSPLRRSWPILLLLLLASGAIAWAILVRGPRAQHADTRNWQASEVRSLTSDPGPERRPHISPDGTRVAFAVADAQSGLDRIVVRSMQPSQRIHLTVGTNRHEAAPAWSPDGTRIAFERLGTPECAMFVASSLGGDEREVGTCRDYNVNYYDWTPDGRALITAQARAGDPDGLALVRWNLDSGQRTFLDYPRQAGDEDLEPRYSPDGRWIAFRRGVAPYSDLFVIPAAGGAARQVTHVAARIRGYGWAPDSHTLILATNFEGPYSLYAADIAGGRLQALGVSPAEYPDVARDSDSVVYEIPRTRETLAFVPLGATAAPPQPLAPSTGNDSAAELSPSGERIAFVSDRGGRVQLWLCDRDGGNASPLTDDTGGAVLAPHWSSDGKRIVVVRRTDPGGRGLVEIDVATRRQRVLSPPGENVLFGMYGVDPDSYLLAVGSSGRDNQLLLVAHPGTPGETRRVLASGVAYAQVDLPARAVYYTAERGLFRRDLDAGSARFITAKVNSITMNGWRVVDGRIWYGSGIGIKSTLHEIDPASTEERVVASLAVALEDVNFSVTPGRDGIIVTPIGAEDTDVGTFRLARAGDR